MKKEIKTILVDSLIDKTEDIPVIGDAFKHFPIVKVIKSISNNLKKISNTQEAFIKAIVNSYSIALVWSIYELQNTPIEYPEDEFKAGLLPFTNLLFKQLYEKHSLGELSLNHFNVNNLVEQKITVYCEKFYFDEVLRKKLDIEDETLNRLKVFINRHLTICLYQLLEHESLKYSVLKNHLQSKEYEISVSFYKKEIYLTALQKMYVFDQLLGENGITLEDTYIEPYFKISRNCFEKKSQSLKAKLMPSNIHEFTYAFLKEENPHTLSKKVVASQFMILLGMPGQGKSSFCKRLLYDVINGEAALPQDIYFIRLRDIDPNQLEGDLWLNLVHIINRQAYGIVYTQLNQVEEFDFSEFDIKKGILILDGLDELEMANDLDKENAIDFCKRLYKLTKSTPLKILLTSRHSRIQETDLESLSILWFEIAPLEFEHQEEWLLKYSAKADTSLRIDELEEFNSFSNNEQRYLYPHLVELLQQPILLQVIAQIYSQISLTEINSRSALYEKLFNYIIDREYDANGILEVFRKWERDLNLRKGIKHFLP